MYTDNVEDTEQIDYLRIDFLDMLHLNLSGVDTYNPNDTLVNK